MDIQAVRGNQLTREQVEAWSVLQRDDTAFASPFFRPEFAAAVASACDDVEVAVLTDKGEYVGFLPYHRSRWNIAQPIGGRLCDFQGVVVRKDLAWDAVELLQRCRLAAWDYDHLLAAQTPLQPYHYCTADSPFLDLSDGFDAYLAEQRQKRSHDQQTLRKKRKLEREVGPLRLDLHTTDRQILELLFAWKGEQYRLTQTTNILQMKWVEKLFERLMREESEAFSPLLTTLHAGDQLVAIHLGLRSHTVLHYWFPTYNRSFASYSPGLVMLMELARTAAQHGIRRVDLGKGPENYKRTFMSASTAVAEGSLNLRPVTASVRRRCRAARQWLLSSPLYRPARFAARGAARIAPPLRIWLKMR